MCAGCMHAEKKVFLQIQYRQVRTVTQPVTKDYPILSTRSDFHLLIILPDQLFGLKLSMLDVCLRLFLITSIKIVQ